MKQYATLMRLFLRENFSLKKILGSSNTKSKGKTILILFALVYGVVAFLGSFGFLFFMLGEAFAQFDMTWMLLMYLFTYVVGLAAMITMFRADSFLFHFKDYDRLAPLPIKPIVVISAKATILMIDLYLVMFAFAIPVIFSYVYFTPVGVMTFVYLIVGLFLSPIPIVIIASLLSMIIARITVRIKHSNFIKIILMFASFFAIMAFSFSFSYGGATGNPLMGQEAFIAALGENYPPMQWFMESVHNQDFLSMVWLLLSHVALMVVFILSIAKASMKINSKAGIVANNSHQKAIVNESRSVFKSLLVKEVRTYFGITFYVVNTSIGIIFMLIAGVASLFYKEQVFAFLSSEIGGGTLSVEPILLVLIGFCLSTIYTTAISLSIEGKKFAFIKSLPIKPRTIMEAKLLFNILLGFPFAVLSLILLGVSFELSPLNVLLMIIAAGSYSVLTSVFGSILNLYMPKFEFSNEIEVIKQSAGALLGIFGGFALLAIDGVLYYFVGKVGSTELSLLVVSLWNFVLGAGFYFWMTRKCESLFMNMAV